MADERVDGVKFEVSVTRVEMKRVKVKEHMHLGTEPEIDEYSKKPTGDTKDIYGYKEFEKDVVFRTKLLEQSVVELDLKSVIRAVNGL